MRDTDRYAPKLMGIEHRLMELSGDSGSLFGKSRELEDLIDHYIKEDQKFFGACK